MLILPSEIFAGELDEVTYDTYAIHYGEGSWTTQTERSVLIKILEKIKMKKAVKKLLGSPSKTDYENVA
jgi:hypothetical protein